MTNTQPQPTQAQAFGTAGTLLSTSFQAVYPLKMLQEIMGHASITSTLDLYGHLSPGDMDRYADRLDSAADRTGKSKISPNEPDQAGDGEGSSS